MAAYFVKLGLELNIVLHIYGAFLHGYKICSVFYFKPCGQYIKWFQIKSLFRKLLDS